MSLHVFTNIATYYGTAANNRAETEGNITTLQKLVWFGQVHSTVSAEAIRFALRRQLATLDDAGTNRTWNEELRSNEWKDHKFEKWADADSETFIDDDLLGFMTAEAASEEGQAGSANVYAGQRLHDDVAGLDDETPEKRSLTVESETRGLTGKVDAVQRRDGAWVVYEHKRGRSRRDEDNRPQAWPSDRIQAIAYSVLVEEELGEPVPQARIRYPRDNVTVFVNVDDKAREDLRDAVTRARELRRSTIRPPVTERESLCRSCSLAPVCLPEEERLPQQDLFERPRRRLNDQGGGLPVDSILFRKKGQEQLRMVCRIVRENGMQPPPETSPYETSFRELGETGGVLGYRWCQS